MSTYIIVVTVAAGALLDMVLPDGWRDVIEKLREGMA